MELSEIVAKKSKVQSENTKNEDFTNLGRARPKVSNLSDKPRMKISVSNDVPTKRVKFNLPVAENDLLLKQQPDKEDGKLFKVNDPKKVFCTVDGNLISIVDENKHISYLSTVTVSAEQSISTETRDVFSQVQKLNEGKQRIEEKIENLELITKSKNKALNDLASEKDKIVEENRKLTKEKDDQHKELEHAETKYQMVLEENLDLKEVLLALTGTLIKEESKCSDLNGQIGKNKEIVENLRKVLVEERDENEGKLLLLENANSRLIKERDINKDKQFVLIDENGQLRKEKDQIIAKLLLFEKENVQLIEEGDDLSLLKGENECLIKKVAQHEGKILLVKSENDQLIKEGHQNESTMSLLKSGNDQLKITTEELINKYKINIEKLENDLFKLNEEHQDQLKAKVDSIEQTNKYKINIEKLEIELFKLKEEHQENLAPKGDLNEQTSNTMNDNDATKNIENAMLRHHLVCLQEIIITLEGKLKLLEK